MANDKWEGFAFRGTAKYPYIQREDPEYGGYKLTVLGISEPAQARFKDLGYEVKTIDGQPSIKISSQYAPEVTDKDGDELTETVGNGSDVIVTVTIQTPTMGKRKGLKTLYLQKVSVQELVVYNGPAGQDEEVL